MRPHPASRTRLRARLRGARREAVERKLRLWSGLLIAAFVVVHLSNHALGLISIEAMERARGWIQEFWGDPIMLALLCGSFAIHFWLALVSLYRRTTLRMPAWEAAQLVLGLLVLPLMANHAIGTRGSRELMGIDVDYPLVLGAIWSDDFTLVRQIALVLVVWLHVVVGLHFWLRLRAWYARAVPWLYAAALLLPVLSLLGFAASGLEIRRQILEEDAAATIFAQVNEADPAARELIRSLDTRVVVAFCLVLGATLFARRRRMRSLARGRRYRLHHANGGLLEVPVGRSVLEAVRAAGIPHASICGGRARCTTCRIRVGRGLANLPEPNRLEAEALARIGADPSVRLACQTRPRSELSVSPLIPAGVTPAAVHQPGGVSGREQEVVIMFIDLRGSTRLGEGRLPYDVVFILNQFFAEMWAALEETGGHYAQFAGDGLMALYGLESGVEVGARQALRGAAGMSRRLSSLNARLEGELAEPLRVGIGIHCGDAIVGTMGPPKSPNLSAVGDNVNIAARLESETKTHGCTLIVSTALARAAGVDLSTHPVHEAELRGRGGCVQVHAIDDPRELPDPGIA